MQPRPQPSPWSFLACVGAASQRTPSEDGSPRVLRRMASELSPRSWISKIFVSGASRTSPTVLRPAAMSACCTFGGSSTFAMDMSSGSSGNGSIMASLFPLTAVILSACKASFGCALKERQRVPGTCVEPLVHQDPHQGASPTPRKVEIAMIVCSAAGVVERRAAEILMNSEAKRQVHVQPEAMMVEIDLDHPKRQLQMKDSKAGLAADLLSDDRWSGRIDAANSHIEHVFPGGRLNEKCPHHVNRRIDHDGWTAHIAHRSLLKRQLRTPLS